MASAKPWQVAVIVIGLLAGGSLIVWTAMSGESVNLQYSMTLVDVENGEAYSIGDYRSANVILPAPRPGTRDQYALVPIEKDETGKWVLGPRGTKMLGAVTVPVKAVDKASGTLAAQPTAFKKYSKE